MKTLPRSWALVAWLLLFSSQLIGCQSEGEQRQGRLLTPQGLQGTNDWSSEQQAQDVAAQPLSRTDYASTSIVRVRTAERPHTHEKSDLYVTVLRGQVLMHLGEQSVDLGPGDVIYVPRGVVHWAISVGSVPAEAYVVATPPYSPDDVQPFNP